jgi:hypothetical protein
MSSNFLCSLSLNGCTFNNLHYMCPNSAAKLSFCTIPLPCPLLSQSNSSERRWLAGWLQSRLGRERETDYCFVGSFVLRSASLFGRGGRLRRVTQFSQFSGVAIFRADGAKGRGRKSEASAQKTPPSEKDNKSPKKDREPYYKFVKSHFVRGRDFLRIRPSKSELPDVRGSALAGWLGWSVEGQQGRKAGGQGCPTTAK